LQVNRNKGNLQKGVQKGKGVLANYILESVDIPAILPEDGDMILSPDMEVTHQIIV
jgi:hypothetical protein